MQQFVLDAWEPVESVQPKAMSTEQSPAVVGELHFRHYLVLLAVPLLFIGAPLLWFVTGEWAAATLCAGVACLLVSCASLLAPDSIGDSEAE